MNTINQRLIQITEGFFYKKIAVWGDIILDEYTTGTTSRISREAPVLILTYKGSEYLLGGAGNSLLNLKALGATPIPVGVTGPDEAGEKIRRHLKEAGISTDFLFVEKNFPTPLKTRILAGEETARKQQVLRIDREEKLPGSSAVHQKIGRSLKSLKKEVGALLISDYNYFTVDHKTFADILPAYKDAGIPVTLDSRFRLLQFPGVTLITPNEPEVEESLRIKITEDDQILRKAGTDLLHSTETEAILITRGSKGMVLFEKGKKPFAVPIHGSTDIVDVTGAGDTVISVFTLALTCGATFQEATLLANHAGGIVVMKKGTAALSVEELMKGIESKN